MLLAPHSRPRPAMTRRCSNCRRWTPAPSGRAGTCSDPATVAAVRSRPEAAGVAGVGTVTRRGLPVLAADAVCPRFAELPVPLRAGR